MNKKIIVMSVLFCLGTFTGFGNKINTVQNKDGITVQTPLFRTVLNAKQGYTIRRIDVFKNKYTFRFNHSGLVVSEDNELDKWKKCYFPRPRTFLESRIATNCEVKEETNQVKCIVKWENETVKVEKQLIFHADQPFIDVSYTIQILKRLEQVNYQLQAISPVFFRKAFCYPGKIRFVTRAMNEAQFSPKADYLYFYNGKNGYGLIRPLDESKKLTLAQGLIYGNRIGLGCYSPPLRWDKVPSEYSFRTRIVIGLSPEKLREMNGKENHPKKVVIRHLEIEKIIQRTGKDGKANLILQNKTGTPQKVTLTSEIEGNLRDLRKLPPQNLEVPPLSDLKCQVKWKNKGENGFSLKCSLLDENGKTLDEEWEYFGITDHFPKTNQMGIVNPGWFHDDWLIDAVVQKFKENYITTIEQYCWAPDQVLDLTPDTEKFVPHTESQGGYSQPLTKTFLKTFVDTAHKNGMYVLAMDTGFLSLDGALNHPEKAKHTKDGQFYLYNGNIHRNKRFNAVGANIFSEKAIKEWAEEMNASVDMFGWDGVRFDWNFIPIATQDPLYVAETKKKKNVHDEARRVSWYTHDNKSAHDLFPDPDQAAADFCNLWRQTVNAKHPNFKYHINYYTGGRALLKEFPKYTKANCRQTGLLNESLLDTSRKYPTWQDWANILTGSLKVARKYGGQPSVGFMRGYAPGGISHRLIHFIMMSSGFHLFGWAGARYSLDDTYLRFRHALRFADYFYDPGFIPQSESEKIIQVTGKGSDRVLWKPFVFERSKGNRREILVHLINLPKDDYIMMHHEVPEVKKNLEVTVTSPEGYELVGADLLVPDPVPHTIKLQPAKNQGKIVVKIPELASMGSLVVDFRKGGAQ